MADGLKSNSMLRLADTLSQNIMLHPFIALRRTCQVNRRCSPFICAQPFSLIPFMYHQQRKQGIAALYKGLSSELLVKGMVMCSETAIANYTDWPRDISSKRFVEDSLKVLALRGLSVALCTPFLCSSVIETVQSVIVVKDRPSFVDCLRDGFYRLLHLRSTPSNRMLPIWLLVVPTVVYHVSHLAFWHIARNCVEFFKNNIISGGSSYTKRTKSTKQTRKHQTNPSRSIMDDSTWQQDDLTLSYNSADISVDSIEVDSNQISTSIMASLIADIALLPVETVLHSLYIQGTRTIIDNCDETTVVLPVLTNYEGFTDCYQSILRLEGNMGLYKGLGAIILQYSIHFLIFRSLYYLLMEFQWTDSSEGNAHQKSLTRHQKKSLKQAATPNNELMRLAENIRYSTPTNPTSEYNLFSESKYNVDDTPKRYLGSMATYDPTLDKTKN